MGVAKIRKAVIPAAGLGTRFLPASKAVPKEMLPIVDVPAIQIVVEEAVAAGIEQIILVSGRHKPSIEEHFDHAFEVEHILRDRGNADTFARLRSISSMVEVVSVRQKEALGLGHAVLCAKNIVGDEPFAVLLPDDLFDGAKRPGIAQLCDVYEKTQIGSIGVMEVPAAEVQRYGIIGGQKDDTGHMRISTMVEKPAPSDAPSRFAAIGRYVLSPKIWPLLTNTKAGVGDEIQLTDALRELAKSPDAGLYGVVLEGRRHDVGNQLGFLEANIAYALKRPELREGLMRVMERSIKEDQ